MSRGVSGAGLVVLAVGMAACQLMVPADGVQCRVDADCAVRGGPFADSACISQVCVARAPVVATPDAGSRPEDPRWACLGKVEWPVEDRSIIDHVRNRVVTLVTEAPVPDIELLVCAAADEECGTPIARARADAEGYVAFDIPRGLRGYYLLRSPPAGVPELAGMMPVIVELIPPNRQSDPLEGDIPATMALHVGTREEYSLLMDSIGQTLEPGLGHIIAAAIDCQGNVAAGVSARPTLKGPKTLEWYAENNGTISLTSSVTANSGQFGYMNLPVGRLTLESTVPELARRHASVPIRIRADTITQFTVAPSPLP